MDSVDTTTSAEDEGNRLTRWDSDPHRAQSWKYDRRHTRTHTYTIGWTTYTLAPRKLNNKEAQETTHIVKLLPLKMKATAGRVRTSDTRKTQGWKHVTHR